jgi:pimeloyl-ACP methyl ester carboxylesterase
MLETHSLYGNNPAAGNYCMVNGIRLYYEVYGSGPPLLLLHGNMQSIAAFQRQIPFFERQYRVIVPDCRGRGRSSCNDNELTYHNQALDMKLLLEHLQVAAAHVIGWSDGGIIGLIMAMLYPDKVLSLVACGANVRQDETALFEDDLQTYRDAYENNTFSGMEHRLLRLLLLHPNLSFEELAVIKCPVLIAAGEHDVIRREHTVQIHRSIPGSQLWIAPGARHNLVIKQHELFNKRVAGFLEGVV